MQFSFYCKICLFNKPWIKSTLIISRLIRSYQPWSCWWLYFHRPIGLFFLEPLAGFKRLFSSLLFSFYFPIFVLLLDILGGSIENAPCPRFFGMYVLYIFFLKISKCPPPPWFRHWFFQTMGLGLKKIGGDQTFHTYCLLYRKCHVSYLFKRKMIFKTLRYPTRKRNQVILLEPYTENCKRTLI